MKGIQTVALATAFVLSGTYAPAAGTPTQKCQSGKDAASAKYIKTVLGCASKAAKSGTEPDAQCLSDAAIDVDAAFLAAQTKAGVECNGVAAVSRATLDDLYDAVVAGTPAGGDAASCAAARRKAAGGCAAALLKAEGKNLAAPDAVKLGGAISKAETKLSSSFTKSGSCAGSTSTQVLAAIHDAVDGLTDCIGSSSLCKQYQSDVSAGGTLDSGTASVTLENPVATSITSPVAGTIRIVESQTAGSPPSGYESLGVRVAIEAPDATAADPLIFTFRFFASLLPPEPSLVTLTRNGVVVPPCTGTPGTADPDPCESTRSILGDGDLSITALTSHASYWDGSVFVCKLTGKWESPANPGYLIHLVEQPDKTIRSLTNFVLGTVDPLDTIANVFTHDGSVVTLDSDQGTIDAACGMINIPALTGTDPTLVRVDREACGDGTTQAGESCDDGNFTAGDGCNPYGCNHPIIAGGSVQGLDCTLCVAQASLCGNSTVDAGEECDDGDFLAGDNCRSDCTLPCGNGVIDANGSAYGAEICDDGNTAGGDCCSSTCVNESPPVCGDGCLIGVIEQCDDHNTTNGDGCSSTCHVE